MVIRIGELREVVKFEKNVPVSTDSGGEVDGFVGFLTARGKLRKNHGNRSLEAGAALYDSGYELTVRFQTALQNELENNRNVRIICNNKLFTIDSYTVYEERFFYYIFKLNEQALA